MEVREREREAESEMTWINCSIAWCLPVYAPYCRFVETAAPQF
ncbi:Protein CBG26075 [Caenorhabditis briggsae]|uniref:Protein CBG26075 n=1 Tax=Caenorhabditis briggsae TaxID=6238 RepID=B6ILQ8_CAEBR|nr:Protein CBG26075 [Caenorhabditis briggsae]CAS00838.1 Protein CBG26075 [Caenorhabditis briggsae]